MTESRHSSGNPQPRAPGRLAQRPRPGRPRGADRYPAHRGRPLEPHLPPDRLGSPEPRAGSLGSRAAPREARGQRARRLLVLRRPPLGHVLPTAHDMSREFRVLSALADTPVPVAPLVAACTDDEVIGAPFYVMEYVPGVVLRTRADTKELTEAQAADLSRCLADMLAAIHGVDVGRGRARRPRPRRRVPAAPARPLAAAVGAVRDPGDARLRPAGRTADRRAARGRPDNAGPRRLPAGQRAGHAGPRDRGSRPWWTGRWPPWATRWPTWA